MKNFCAKIWFPTLLVALAAFQSFGIDAGRALSIAGLRDSLTLSRIEDSSAAVAVAAIGIILADRTIPATNSRFC